MQQAVVSKEEHRIWAGLCIAMCSYVTLAGGRTLSVSLFLCKMRSGTHALFEGIYVSVTFQESSLATQIHSVKKHLLDFWSDKITWTHFSLLLPVKYNDKPRGNPRRTPVEESKLVWMPRTGGTLKRQGVLCLPTLQKKES